MTENMKEYWRKRKEDIKQVSESGHIVLMYRERRLQVIVPKHPEFSSGAAKLAGRFRPRTGMWSFDRRLEWAVRELIERIWPGHGKDSITVSLDAVMRHIAP